MNLLLDTHVFLWYVSGDARLSTAVRDQIISPLNQVVISVVCIWEAIIKWQTGKLPLPESPDIYLPRVRNEHRIGCLSVDEASVLRLSGLPLLHRGPFDRILICQALEHGLTPVTMDPVVLRYPVPV